MVGPFGYDADMSRTFFCGPGRPTGQQRTLYCVSYEQVQHNVELMRPGTSFRELAERAWRAPDKYADQAEDFFIHGIGMCNEYPQVVPARNFGRRGYDGMLLENMTVCVESYIGERGEGEGVRLEQLVLVTARGPRVLTTFPFEEELLR
jgi:Xaa-Pro aminopeptidase